MACMKALWFLFGALAAREVQSGRIVTEAEKVVQDSQEVGRTSQQVEQTKGSCCCKEYDLEDYGAYEFQNGKDIIGEIEHYTTEASSGMKVFNMTVKAKFKEWDSIPIQLKHMQKYTRAKVKTWNHVIP
eukprot:gnl/TRDRNA2_/TRDRNA2_41277_c0_seq1.p1 gnl/TRDRNA2_/TRDRNA2_41277_c0~~gnl/TRDRNA2_/TRDRNA2_41277_c0_seq1.p1  ORF type:complete len:129 (-),score=27.41 gnl/TRDRNA2_/TRDRNA2_41277_c0_seq1:317-703(-)